MINKFFTENHQVVIVANGVLPSCDIILKLADNRSIIATDGSYDKLKLFNIEPDFVIGDKDSIASVTDYIHIQDQDSTDLEKAISYCRNRAFNKIMILGAFGGELDHTLNNIMSISKYMDNDVEFAAIDQYFDNKIKLGIFLKNSQINFSCIKNTIISILPLPSATISTTGLKWELYEEKLVFDLFTSARNYNLQNDVTVNCIDGKILIIIDWSL